MRPASGPPCVAVVILNWNGRGFLEQFLPSVCASTYPGLRIVVADNASTDDSVQFVQDRFPNVELVHNSKNGGFAEGYNEALQKVQADYYVLLNQDVEVTPGWIEPVISLMESRRDIGACQPKICSWKQKDRFEYAGAAGGWMDVLGYPFCRGRLFDVLETDTGQYNQDAEIFWATGAALFIRSALYHEAGGFDPFFFSHMEEIDLCWRLKRMGHRVYCCPASVVYHVGGGSLPQGNPRKVYLNFRNNLLLLYKNLPSGPRLRTIGIRLLLDGIAALRSLLAGRPLELAAIFRAHRDFYRWLARSRSLKTSLDLPGYPLGHLSGVYRGSIVWNHFVRGIKTFTALGIVDK